MSRIWISSKSISVLTGYRSLLPRRLLQGHRRGGALALPLILVDYLAEEIELDGDVVGVLEEDLEELRVGEAAEVHLHLVLLDALADLVRILGKEGDVVHGARSLGAFGMLLQQESVADLVRLLRSEVHADVVADFQPVAGKAEVRALGELQSEHVLVELLRALEVLRHEQVVVEFGEWHGFS